MSDACYNPLCSAGVAHLVERHLAKVEVAGSSPVARSSLEGEASCFSLFFQREMPNPLPLPKNAWGVFYFNHAETLPST